ncbi:MAG: Na+/H+ antiporter NhaA [Candidatus Nanopelagicaceae bacterium]
MKRRIYPLRDFLNNESSSGIVLVIAALLGMIIANTSLSDEYFSILDYAFEIEMPGIFISLTVLKLINYAFMTLFFFVVGLEIKRELTSGHLSSLKSAIAPFIAALGGMAFPAVIYLIFAGDIAPSGWAIPVATDIALAVGLMAIIGTQAGAGLRAFLLALAVMDDIAAILIIAVVYSTGVVISWGAGAGAAILATFLLQKFRARSPWFYLPAGALLWYSLYRAGLHPTLAGVIMGLLTPAINVENSKLEDGEDGQLTLIEILESKLHSYSSFLVVPLFAFSNSGVALSSDVIETALDSPIAWGIFFGLVIGKPLGIFATSKLFASRGLIELPEKSSAPALIATGSVAGIGFTVAIFIAKLAFEDRALQDIAVMAVILGSLVSAILALAIFKIIKR